MPLRVAFTPDGVLANVESALARLAGQLFDSGSPEQGSSPTAASPEISKITAGPNGDEVPPPHDLQMTTPRQRVLWGVVRATDRFWESLDEIEPGAVARLAAVAAARRWEVIFLTRRPSTAGPTAQVQTQRWLEAKGFPLPSVYAVDDSRGPIAAALALDVVVDEVPEDCLDVAARSKATAIALFRNRERAVPPAFARLGIHVVHSLDECLNLLSAIDAGPQPRPGVTERAMRILGLK